MAASSWSVRNIDLISLRLFAATIEEGVLAKTAEREHIAISAVSRRISDLEQRCGVPLIERHDRGISPTAAGQKLYEGITDVLRMLDRIVLDMEAFRVGQAGHVRVQAHMSATSALLPERIASFVALHPDIDVELDENTSIEVMHAVRSGVADLGLVSGTLKADGLLEVLPWQEDELVAVLPRGHPLLAQETLVLADLVKEPFIGMQRDSALLALYRNQAAALNQKLRERVHATSFESVRKMVSVGLGVAILPAVAAYPFAESAGIAIRPLREVWARRPLMLCVRDRTRLSAATRKLIDHLLADGPP